MNETEWAISEGLVREVMDSLKKEMRPEICSLLRLPEDYLKAMEMVYEDSRLHQEGNTSSLREKLELYLQREIPDPIIMRLQREMAGRILGTVSAAAYRHAAMHENSFRISDSGDFTQEICSSLNDLFSGQVQKVYEELYSQLKEQGELRGRFGRVYISENNILCDISEEYIQETAKAPEPARRVEILEGIVAEGE
jgi:hypothetical protein